MRGARAFWAEVDWLGERIIGELKELWGAGHYETNIDFQVASFFLRSHLGTFTSGGFWRRVFQVIESLQVHSLKSGASGKVKA
jgi:hypothetical protein